MEHLLILSGVWVKVQDGLVQGLKFLLDDGEQQRQANHECSPHAPCGNVLVFMAIDISCGSHITPFDRRVTGLQFVGQSTRRFGDDFQGNVSRRRGADYHP
jgi:hypothetical protein